MDDAAASYVASDDFSHDVRLYVSGDFADGEQRMRYTEEIARRLNAAPSADAGVREAALRLYAAGRWTLDGVHPSEQARLWEGLRDALGLPSPGSVEAARAALSPAAQQPTETKRD
jgi:hypothetical protein